RGDSPAASTGQSEPARLLRRRGERTRGTEVAMVSPAEMAVRAVASGAVQVDAFEELLLLAGLDDFNDLPPRAAPLAPQEATRVLTVLMNKPVTPGSLERLRYMTRGEQIKALSKLTTHIIVTFGTAGGTTSTLTRTLGGLEATVPVLSLSARGELVLGRVVVPVGKAATALSGGPGAAIILYQGGPGGGGGDESGAGRTGGTKWKPGPNDLDWRGMGKGLSDALNEAFKRTGVSREEFSVTRWGKDKFGKSAPVEWRAPNGAEVNIDMGHTKNGPSSPHVGFQTPGKRGSGGAVRGHILLDEVPFNR
ncbi:MAG TPA: polymorphic toxin type 47 domain-containing protein, partial [Archangium sp.]|uniref:polymorphic toxin type 47 domain-containing protein n=1 Tax=Archangium sp. TaxID=1872627 RepID=UPI002E2F623C